MVALRENPFRVRPPRLPRVLVFNRPSTWIILLLGTGYFVALNSTAHSAIGQPARLRWGEIFAGTLGDPNYLIFGLLTVWLATCDHDAHRTRRPDYRCRYGSTSAMFRAEVLAAGVVRDLWLLGTLYTLWGGFTLLEEFQPGPRTALYEALPDSPGALAILLGVHTLGLLLFLTLCRGAIFLAMTLSPWLARPGLGLFWILLAISANQPQLFPEVINPIAAMDLLALTPDVAAQIRGVSRVLLALGALLLLARAHDFWRSESRSTRLGTALRSPSRWGPGAAIILFGLCVAVTARAEGSPMPLSAVLHHLYDGYRGTLVQALIEASLTLGVVLVWLVRRDEPAQRGLAEQMLLRRGSRARAYRAVLTTEIPRVLRYVGVLTAITLVAWGSVSGNLTVPSRYESEIPVMVATHLILGGAIQILVYLAVVAVMTEVARNQALARGSLLALILLPLPGAVLSALPLHRAGIADLSALPPLWPLIALGGSALSVLSIIGLIGLHDLFLTHRSLRRKATS